MKRPALWAAVFRPDRRLLVPIAAVLTALVAACPARAAETEADAGVEVATAPVQIDGRTLLSVRGVSSLPAAERAALIAQRIEDVARDPRVNPASIAIVAGPLGPEIRANGRFVMAVNGADAELEGVAADTLAASHRRVIAAAIERYRAERSPEQLMRSAAVSLAATVLLVAAIVLLGFLFARLNASLARRYQAGVEALSGKLGDAIKVAPMLRAMQGSLQTGRIVIYALLAFIWLDVVLGQFPWTRWLSDDLASLVLDPLGTIALGVADYLPKLIFLIVLAAITRFGLRILRLYFAAVERGRVQLPNFDPEWSLPTYKIIRTLVIGIALVMAYPYLPGSGTEALRGISVFAGLLLSLGASSSVANVIAGYLTTFGRVVRLGDLIKVGEVMGVVTQVRLLTTRVRTFRNEEITIPNSTIIGSSIVNFTALSKERGLILQIDVGIGYEVPWRQVHAMLLEAARRTPGLKAEPAPFVLQTKLGDFAVVYQLNVYKAGAEGLLLTRSNLHQNVLDLFNEHGVQIMTPAYEGDPQEPKVVPRQNWFAAPATREGPDAGGQ